jgi:DNA-binding winged helix-turn-helix (wHTH) protein
MRLRFGEFVLDPDARTLQRARVEVPVEPLVFDCIELLARQPGVLVRMEDFRARLWPTVHVAAGALRRVINEARRVLGDSGEAQALIRTRKGLGYVFVGVVSVEHTTHAADRYDPLRAWPFVGRANELELLLRWVGEAGPGGVCLVGGEAGVGKSRLIARLQRDAARCGTWLSGQCHAAPEQPAFWPYREITRQLLARRELRAEALRLAQAAKCIGLAIPELDSRDTRRPQLEPAQARFEACEAWAGMLGALARVQPLQIVLEDMHWADEGSAWMLAALARTAQREPLHVCVSYRPEALVGSSAFARVLAQLRGRTGVLELPLAGLSEAALLSLMNELGMSDANERMATELVRRTGGNALFVHELLSHALASARPLADAAPASFDQIVAERTACVPERTRELIALAALLGCEFDLGLLSAVAESASHTALLEALEPALRAGLLKPMSERPDRLAFAHSLVCDVLARSLPAQARQAGHLAALRALRLQPSAASRAALAGHAFGAGALVAPFERRRACEEAGRAAFEHGEFDRASLWLGRAVSLLAPDDDSPEAAALALLWAKARWHADDPEPEVAAALLLAAERARRARQPELLAEAAIVYSVGDDSLLDNRILFVRPDAPALIEEAWRALVREAPSAIEDTDLAHRLATVLAWYRLDGSEVAAMQHWAELALRLAPSKLSPARYGIMLGLRAMTRPSEARAVLAELQVHVERAELGLRERIEGRMMLLFIALTHGELAQYERAVREIRALAHPLADSVRVGRFGERLSIYLGLPLLAEITLCVVRGRLAEAAERLAALPRELERLGFARSRRVEMNLLGVWRWLAVYQGKSCTLEPLVDGALRDDPDAHWLGVLLKLGFALERGDAALAREQYGTLRATAFEPILRGVRLPARIATTMEIADACTRVGSDEDAALLYARLIPQAGLVVSDGTLVCWGACDRVLGALAQQLGRYADAARHFEAALALNARLGHRPETVRTELAYADLCDALGRAQEGEQCRARARTDAAAIGMGLPTSGNRQG